MSKEVFDMKNRTKTLRSILMIAIVLTLVAVTAIAIGDYKPCPQCGSWQAVYNPESYVTPYTNTEHRYACNERWDCPNCGPVGGRMYTAKTEKHSFRVIRDYGFSVIDGRRHKLLECSKCKAQTERSYDR